MSPEITSEQFSAATSDILEIIRSGQSPANHVARVGVDLSIVVGRIMQFVRDRADPTRPIFGTRGDEELDGMADSMRSIAQELDGDGSAQEMMAAPVEGPVVDWVLQLGLKKLIDWIQQAGVEQWIAVLNALISQLGL